MIILIYAHLKKAVKVKVNKVHIVFGVTFGLVAVAVLSACGSSSTTPPLSTTLTTSVARQYSALLLSGELDGTTATDGTTVTQADCTDKQVDARGVGTYDCSISYSDNTTYNKVIQLNADGTYKSQ